MSVEITDLQKVKMEDGDILLITVPPNTPSSMISRFRETTTMIFREKFGEKCHVIIAAVEPGEMSLSIAKRNELSDMHQQIDDLAAQVEALQERADDPVHGFNE